MGPEAKSRRGIINDAYRTRAIGLIVGYVKDTGDAARFAWLCDGEKMQAGEPNAWQPTILIELGKIRDVGAMFALADRLCEIKPKAKEGALMVRQARVGKPAGDDVQLACELLDTLSSYLERREVTWREVKSAVGLLDAVIGSYIAELREAI